MSENETTGMTNRLGTANGWLELMDLVIGEEIMLLPVAGGGNGFQGTLVEFILGANGPAFFVIEKIGSPRVTINFSNVAMVTRVIGPSAPQVTPADLVKLADENGLDVPAEVREAIANLES